MLYGTYQELRQAYRRLKHFEPLCAKDGAYTALTPLGRNLAMFYDFGNTDPPPTPRRPDIHDIKAWYEYEVALKICGEQISKDAVNDYIGGMLILAGTGDILAKKCDAHTISESPDILAEIGAWLCRLRALVDPDIYLAGRCGPVINRKCRIY